MLREYEFIFIIWDTFGIQIYDSSRINESVLRLESFDFWEKQFSQLRLIEVKELRWINRNAFARFEIFNEFFKFAESIHCFFDLMSRYSFLFLSLPKCFHILQLELHFFNISLWFWKRKDSFDALLLKGRLVSRTIHLSQPIGNIAPSLENWTF